MFSRGSRTKPSFATGTPGRGFRPKTIDRYLHQMNCRSASPKDFMTCDFQSQEVLLLKMFSKLEVMIYLTKNAKDDEASSSLGSLYHTIELRSKNEWVAKKKSGWGLIGCILPKWPYILNLFQVNDLSIGSCWIISLRVVRGFARMEAIAISCNAREFTLVRQPKGIRRCESGALGSVVFSSKSHFTMESNYLEIGLSCGWWACHGVIGLGLWFNRLLAQIATSISWMKSCQIRTLICDTKFWKNRRLADTHTHTHIFVFFWGEGRS